MRLKSDSEARSSAISVLMLAVKAEESKQEKAHARGRSVSSIKQSFFGRKSPTKDKEGKDPSVFISVFSFQLYFLDGTAAQPKPLSMREKIADMQAKRRVAAERYQRSLGEQEAAPRTPTKSISAESNTIETSFSVKKRTPEIIKQKSMSSGTPQKQVDEPGESDEAVSSKHAEETKASSDVGGEEEQAAAAEHDS